MNASLAELLRQAQSLPPDVKFDLAMALLERARASVMPRPTRAKWASIRGSYAPPMFGEVDELQA